MKITRPEDKNVCEYSDLETGDVFEFKGNFYIKTSKLKSYVANAVKLADGMWETENDGQ